MLATHTGPIRELHRTCLVSTTSENYRTEHSQQIPDMSGINTGHVRYNEQHRATLGEKSKTLANGLQKL